MTIELAWLLALHIAGLAVWCGSLLYLPALVASGTLHESHTAFEPGPAALNRLVFTRIATPAALFAIVTGSALFLLDRSLGIWLILKLTAVTGMAICHVLLGVLILRQERDPDTSYTVPCALLGAASTILIGTVLWLVLFKPFQDT